MISSVGCDSYQYHCHVRKAYGQCAQSVNMILMDQPLFAMIKFSDNVTLAIGKSKKIKGSLFRESVRSCGMERVSNQCL